MSSNCVPNNPLVIKVFLILFLSFQASIFLAQKETESEANKPIPLAEVSVTKQKVVINDQTINLTAHAGTMQLRDENN